MPGRVEHHPDVVLHRNASVIATTPVTVAMTLGRDLRDRLDELPGLRARLEKAATERSPG